MREIKFRVWQYKWETYADHYKNVSPKMDYDYSFDESTRINKFHDDEDIAIMQYTGLNDKNGKEIYEGDVVTVSFATQWAKHKANEYVIFEDGKFITHGGHGLGRKGTEVLGNIYENPELVK